MTEEDIQADEVQDPDHIDYEYVPYGQIEEDTKDENKPEIDFDEQVCYLVITKW